MPASPGLHPSDDDFELYSLRRTSETDVAGIEEHLLVCEQCRNRLEEIDAYVAAMKQALVEVEPETAAHEEPVEKTWRSWLAAVPRPAWAAAAAVLALALVFIPESRAPRELHSVQLETWRGAPDGMNSSVPAGQPLAITADVTGVTGLSGYVVEVADSAGDAVFTESYPAGGTKIELTLESGLASGQYWVRVYESAGQEGGRGELLREFGLRVE